MEKSTIPNTHDTWYNDDWWRGKQQDEIQDDQWTFRDEDEKELFVTPKKQKEILFTVKSARM